MSDRRVLRTQDTLRRALVELILERGFESITVSDITERANVGRSTFYAHYADKDDLLQGSLEMLRGMLEARIAAAKAEQRRNVHPALFFSLPMLEHAAEQRALFMAMLGRKGGQLLQELIHDIWADLVRKHWEEADELAVQAIAGGFGSVVHWWMTRAPELSPADVDTRFRAVVEGRLAGTRRKQS